MPTTPTDYHAEIRDAVVAALKATGLMNCPVKAFDASEDMLDDTVPVVGCACVGPEQDRPEYGTNERTGTAYPVAVALLTAGTTRGEKTDGPPTGTLFRRIVKNTFHDKRLSGVDEVCVCEVSDAGPIWDPKNPRFQRLETALVVNCVGRFPRS